MLENADAEELIEAVWDSLGCTVTLPNEWSNFFEQIGRISGQYDDRRMCGGRCV